MRKRKNYQYQEAPNGYPYMLFSVRKNGKLYYGTGVSKEQAIENMGITFTKGDSIEPVRVFQEIATAGHQKTHNLFKKFGDHWITKKGKVYFPPKSLK